MDEDNDKANKWMRESLAIREDVPGKCYEETADSFSWIALMLDGYSAKKEEMAMHRKTL